MGRGILKLKEKPAGTSPAEVAAALYDGGVRRLLLDGGHDVATPFLDAGLVDRVVAYLPTAARHGVPLRNCPGRSCRPASSSWARPEPTASSASTGRPTPYANSPLYRGILFPEREDGTGRFARRPRWNPSAPSRTPNMAGDDHRSHRRPLGYARRLGRDVHSRPGNRLIRQDDTHDREPRR